MNTAYSIEESEIVRLFHRISHTQSIKNSQNIEIQQARPASNEEWEQMTETFRLHHPRLYLLITVEHKLTLREYRVCVLSRLKFSLKEMATLLNSSEKSVNNARSSIARKVFNMESTMSLNEKLQEL